MGCCTSSKRKADKEFLPDADQLAYSQITKINVVARNQGVGSQTQLFRHTTPLFDQCIEVSVGDVELKISKCVLPGKNPRTDMPKTCQDYCFVENWEDVMLMGLYDGHGQRGENVARFCENYVRSQFKENPSQLKKDPNQFLSDITLKCADALFTSEIDTTTSGTTQVLCAFHSNHLYLANVGDSRAILGSNRQIDTGIQNLPIGDHAKYLEDIKMKRAIQQTSLHLTQLTKDQNPDDPEERERILNLGGAVYQVTDQDGNKLGPHRVWNQKGNLPGLAMSRSMGDDIGTELGVIATPALTEIELDFSKDQFMVIASDGVWNVLTNQDVINFIEKYRRHCKLQRGQAFKVTPRCVSIAQLLCEEARVRWMAIAEYDEISIDDISVIVAEFNYQLYKN